MNLPPNISEGLSEKFKEVVDNIRFSQKICKGKIFSVESGVIWEESEEDYQTRMNKLFYEVK